MQLVDSYMFLQSSPKSSLCYQLTFTIDLIIVTVNVPITLPTGRNAVAIVATKSWIRTDCKRSYKEKVSRSQRQTLTYQLNYHAEINNVQ